MIFISYAKEDLKSAKRIYYDLKNLGISCWLDSECLLPGQNWDEVISKTIRDCDLFLALLSKHSLTKRGFVQKELKVALKCIDKFPSNEIFIIPVRIEDCWPHDDKLLRLHFADIFESYEKGFSKILKAIELKRLPKDDDRISIKYNEVIYDQIENLEYEKYQIVQFEYIAPFDARKLYFCPKCGATCQRYTDYSYNEYTSQGLRACLQCGLWVYLYSWDDGMGELHSEHLKAAIGLTRNIINFPCSCPLWKSKKQ